MENHEPIEITRYSYGGPWAFSWRGREYVIQSSNRSWLTGFYEGTRQHHITVTTIDGDFELYQDYKTNNWYIICQAVDCS